MKFAEGCDVTEKLYEAIKATLENTQKAFTTEIHESAKASEQKKPAYEDELPPVPKLHQDLRPTGLPGAVERKRKMLEKGKTAMFIPGELTGLQRNKNRAAEKSPDKCAEVPGALEECSSFEQSFRKNRSGKKRFQEGFTLPEYLRTWGRVCARRLQQDRASHRPPRATNGCSSIRSRKLTEKSIPSSLIVPGSHLNYKHIMGHGKYHHSANMGYVLKNSAKQRHF